MDLNNSENYIYFDLSTQERDSALRFLLHCILKVRKNKNLPTRLGKDEDVNIYLAHLLFAVALPEYHEMSTPYLSKESSDVLKWAKQTEDKTLKYFIYKVNADHILLNTTVFQTLKNQSSPALFRKSDQYYRELAVLYYEQAARCHQNMYRKKTGIGEVLSKVANDYSFYQGMLAQVQEDYFYFVNSFREHGFKNFAQEVQEYEAHHTYDDKMDEFLSLYYQFLETRDESLKERIVFLCKSLMSINPDFHFDLSKLEGPSQQRRVA